MQPEEAKATIRAVAKANEERRRLEGTLNGNGDVASDARKLFREGNESKLIKLGMAVIAFPEPTPVSPIVGAGLVTAGAMQKGIRNRAAFAEDIGRDLKSALKELSRARDQVRI